MKTWCLVTLSFVVFSALFFDTCSSAAFSEETESKLKRTHNEETNGFGRAALNDREENDHWAREYDENDVDDHDWANDIEDSANEDENNEDQSDMENEEGGKYEDEEQDTIEEDDECEDKELSDLLEDDYDNDDDNDYYDDDDADDLSDKSDLAEWDADNDEEGRFLFFFLFFLNWVYYKAQKNYVDKLSSWFVSPLFFIVNDP